MPPAPPVRGAADMAGLPYGKFYWSDWQADPKLRVCSLAAQGLWMRMLCVMAEAKPTGYLLIGCQPCTTTDLAAIVGRPAEEVQTLLDELKRWEVFSENRAGTIYSRRMVKDSKISQKKVGT